jgi:hypothetical protein
MNHASACPGFISATEPLYVTATTFPQEAYGPQFANFPVMTPIFARQIGYVKA